MNKTFVLEFKQEGLGSTKISEELFKEIVENCEGSITKPNKTTPWLQTYVVYKKATRTAIEIVSKDLEANRKKRMKKDPNVIKEIIDEKIKDPKNLDLNKIKEEINNKLKEKGEDPVDNVEIV